MFNRDDITCFACDAPQVIYSSIIKGFAQGKQAEKCFRTLEEMEAQGRLTRRWGNQRLSPVVGGMFGVGIRFPYVNLHEFAVRLMEGTIHFFG